MEAGGRPRVVVRTHAQRLAGRDGYFLPGSVVRRVGNAALVPLLGGGAAVLLQVAHPLVAAGVVAHSEYERDVWRRFVRSLRALYLIVYGSKAEAEAAGALVRAVHGRVGGVTDQALGVFPAGTVYSAADPELMLWVHATLVETSLAAYGRFVAELSRADQQRYYSEMAVVAELFGTPASVIPPTLDEFRDYFHEQVEGGVIAVTSPARRIAAVILDAPMPGPLRLVVPSHRLSTAALLPPRVREGYGLGWGRRHAFALGVGARGLRLAAAPLWLAASRYPSPTPTRAA
jgi:uncharacterized protein (DUF2236 family)